MSEFIYTAAVLCALEHEQRVRNAANTRSAAGAHPRGPSLLTRARTAVQLAAAHVNERMWSGPDSARETIVSPSNAPATTSDAVSTSSSVS